jgi:ComF family protein
MRLSWLNHLLPQSCYLCGAASSGALCSGCLSDLPYYLLENTCFCCARPLHQEFEEVYCTHCQYTPPYFSHIYPIFSYEYPINHLIQAAKFEQNLTILTQLAELMVQQIDYQHLPDVLIPIPLHSKRLRQRGYNQSLEIAKIVARQLQLPLAATACERIRYTLPQVELNGSERSRNLRGAFQVRKLQQDWQYVVLIDDVMTTGTTVNELAAVLRHSGVPRVDVWCCARALQMW